jgi:hypothetical protein
LLAEIAFCLLSLRRNVYVCVSVSSPLRVTAKATAAPGRGVLYRIEKNNQLRATSGPSDHRAAKSKSYINRTSERETVVSSFLPLRTDVRA